MLCVCLALHCFSLSCNTPTPEAKLLQLLIVFVSSERQTGAEEHSDSSCSFSKPSSVFSCAPLSAEGCGDCQIMVWSPAVFQLLIPLECDLWRNPSGLGSSGLGSMKVPERETQVYWVDCCCQLTWLNSCPCSISKNLRKPEMRAQFLL